MYRKGHAFFSPSGQVLDCSLAKADKKDNTVSVPTAKGGPLLPSYTPLGYGLAGANPLGNGLAGAYNPLGNGLAGVYNPLGNGLAGAYGVLPARAAQVHDIICYALANA
jgi:heterogeneous nuclear ribonucleoprotein R